MRSVAKLSFQLERAIYLSASLSTGLHYRNGNTGRLIQNCSAIWGVSRDPKRWRFPFLRLLYLPLLASSSLSVSLSVRIEKLGVQ